MRSRLRRAVPFALRWRARELRRRLRDLLAGSRFAPSGGGVPTAPYAVCEYRLPLVCYPGQEGAFEAKRKNIELALRSLDCVAVRPGEVLSFWKCIGRPAASRGYGQAAALKDGELTMEVGGAICFVSTLLYNAMLLSGMAILERFCHSVDSYGDARYFEPGRDAAVEYAYRDLRARNDSSGILLLGAAIVAGDAQIAVRSVDERLCVAVRVCAGSEDRGSFSVRTLRHVVAGDRSWTDDLGLSVYRKPREAPLARRGVRC